MRYFLSYLALLPAAILCYLPVIHHVRVRKTLLILGGILLFFFRFLSFLRQDAIYYAENNKTGTESP